MYFLWKHAKQINNEYLKFDPIYFYLDWFWNETVSMWKVQLFPFEVLFSFVKELVLRLGGRVIEKER